MITKEDINKMFAKRGMSLFYPGSKSEYNKDESANLRTVQPEEKTDSESFKRNTMLVTRYKVRGHIFFLFIVPFFKKRKTFVFYPAAFINLDYFIEVGSLKRQALFVHVLDIISQQQWNKPFKWWKQYRNDKEFARKAISTAVRKERKLYSDKKMNISASTLITSMRQYKVFNKLTDQECLEYLNKQ